MLAEARDSSLPHNVKITSGAHPAAYSTGSLSAILGGSKQPG